MLRFDALSSRSGLKSTCFLDLLITILVVPMTLAVRGAQILSFPTLSVSYTFFFSKFSTKFDQTVTSFYIDKAVQVALGGSGIFIFALLALSIVLGFFFLKERLV